MRKLGMQHYVECTMQISKFVWLSVYLRKCFSVWWFRLVWWMSFLSISIWFPCFTHSFASLIKSFLKKVISVRLSLFCIAGQVVQHRFIISNTLCMYAQKYNVNELSSHFCSEPKSKCCQNMFIHWSVSFACVHCIL